MAEINLSFNGKKKNLIKNPEDDERVIYFLKDLLLYPQSTNGDTKDIYNYISRNQRMYYKEQNIKKQSFEDFKKEYSKISSERVQNKVLYLFDNPLELVGYSFSCRKSGMLFYAPHLNVKETGKRGYISVYISGYSFHPKVDDCGKKMSRLIGRFKGN